MATRRPGVALADGCCANPLVRIEGVHDTEAIASADDLWLRNAASWASRGPLLDHAYTGHAESVAGLLSDSVAVKLAHEVSGFVPLREPARLAADLRLGSSVSRDLANTGVGACATSARCRCGAARSEMPVGAEERVRRELPLRGGTLVRRNEPVVANPIAQLPESARSKRIMRIATLKSRGVAASAVSP